MTGSYEDSSEGLRDVFAAIMENNQVVLGDDRPETLLCDGQEVVVSAYLGEELRRGLRASFADEMLPPGMPFNGEIGLETNAAELANNILNAHLASLRATVRLGGWLALHGIGAVPASERVGAGAEVVVVDTSSTILGRIAGAGYSMYPHCEQLEGLTASDGEYTGEMTSGLVVLLEDVIVCEARGYGEVGEEFERLTAPLALESLKFYKVCQELSTRRS
jgi:hypothetical protein